jgi:iron complex outermembrane receptor protein
MICSASQVALAAQGAQAQHVLGSDYQIETQSLSAALRQFAAQAKLQLLYSELDVGGKQFPGLSGTFTHEEAVLRLLENTGLTFEKTRPGTIVIRPLKADPASQPSTQTAQNSSAPAREWKRQVADTMGEIIVTARRVEENIQRVPISVIALSENKMNEMSVFDTATLQKVVPGYSSSVGDSAQYVWMRGMLGVASQFADAPYTLRTEGNNYDIGAFQILKGPQGTRFGQSSAAGAIVTDPKRPVNDFHGYIKGVVGTYGLNQVQGAVNFPIIDDRLLFRIAGDSYNRVGYVIAPEINKRYHDEHYFSVRPAFVWKVNDSIENYSMLSYYYNRNNGRLSRTISYRPGGLNAVRSPELPFVVAQTFNAAPGYGMLQVRGVDTRDGFRGEYDKTIFVVNQTMWEINDDFSVKNIFSYYNERRRTEQDVTRLSFNVDPGELSSQVVQERASGPYVRNTWSDELILYGSFLDDMVNVNIGTLHKGVKHPVQYIFGGGGGVLTAYAGKGIRNIPLRSRAVYGSANIDLSAYTVQGLNLELGVRKTWDSHLESRWTLHPNTALPLNQWPGTFEQKRANFSYENWLVGLQYQVTPKSMYYFTAAQGTTFGQVFLSSPPELQVVKPEQLRLLEGGVKSTFEAGGMKFLTNASIYYGWWTNVQVESHVVHHVSPSPAPTLLVPYQSNAGEALVRGMDFDIRAAPAKWLELGMNGAFNKNRFTKFMSVDANNNPVDYSSRGMVGRQTFKYVLDGTVYLPFDPSWGRVGINASWVHQSYEMADGGKNDPSVPKWIAITVANGYPGSIANGEVTPTNVKPAYGELDMSVTWDDVIGMKNLRAVFGVTNVLQQKVAISGGNSWDATGTGVGQAHPPRMFTLGLTYSF